MWTDWNSSFTRRYAVQYYFSSLGLITWTSSNMWFRGIIIEYNICWCPKWPPRYKYIGCDLLADYIVSTSIATFLIWSNEFPCQSAFTLRPSTNKMKIMTETCCKCVRQSHQILALHIRQGLTAKQSLVTHYHRKAFLISQVGYWNMKCLISRALLCHNTQRRQELSHLLSIACDASTNLLYQYCAWRFQFNLLGCRYCKR